MFEEKTYENLLDDVLNNAPPDIDTRQGSIFYDAVSGVLIKIARLYTDLNSIFSLTQLETTAGEYLDGKAAEFGVMRHEAMAAKYHAVLEGAAPDEGERFFIDSLYFYLKYENGEPFFISKETGTIANNILQGSAAVPVDNISGLTSAKFGAISAYGSEPETDENLRRRVFEKIANTAENGNKSHYKAWCESIRGVGKARIFPLWNGENTVKAVLIGYDGQPCTLDTVSAVQEYIDPGGKGLGEGAANLGAHFTAVSAAPLTINISLKAEASQSKEAIKTAIEEAMRNYFKTQVFEAADDEKITVRYTSVGAIIAAIPGVDDYQALKLNGDTKNISVADDKVPVVGGVTIEIL